MNFEGIKFELEAERRVFEKDGKPIEYIQVYLVLPSGYRIAIKNVYKFDRPALLSFVKKVE